jgi:hypothetical protein
VPRLWVMTMNWIGRRGRAGRSRSGRCWPRRARRRPRRARRTAPAAPRAWPAAGHRGQRPLAARQHRQRLALLARRPGGDLDAGRRQVVGRGQLTAAPRHRRRAARSAGAKAPSSAAKVWRNCSVIRLRGRRSAHAYWRIAVSRSARCASSVSSRSRTSAYSSRRTGCPRPARGSAGAARPAGLPRCRLGASSLLLPALDGRVERPSSAVPSISGSAAIRRHDARPAHCPSRSASAPSADAGQLDEQLLAQLLEVEACLHGRHLGARLRASARAGARARRSPRVPRPSSLARSCALTEPARSVRRQAPLLLLGRCQVGRQAIAQLRRLLLLRAARRSSSASISSCAPRPCRARSRSATGLQRVAAARRRAPPSAASLFAARRSPRRRRSSSRRVVGRRLPRLDISASRLRAAAIAVSSASTRLAVRRSSCDRSTRPARACGLGPSLRAALCPPRLRVFAAGIRRVSLRAASHAAAAAVDRLGRRACCQVRSQLGDQPRAGQQLVALVGASIEHDSPRPGGRRPHRRPPRRRVVTRASRRQAAGAATPARRRAWAPIRQRPAAGRHVPLRIAAHSLRQPIATERAWAPATLAVTASADALAAGAPAGQVEHAARERRRLSAAAAIESTADRQRAQAVAERRRDRRSQCRIDLEPSDSRRPPSARTGLGPAGVGRLPRWPPRAPPGAFVPPRAWPSDLGQRARRRQPPRASARSPRLGRGSATRPPRRSRSVPPAAWLVTRSRA